MDEKMIEKAKGFYDYNRIRHNAFCNEMQGLIIKILNKSKQSYNNISGRVKNKNSFIEKCEKDKYNHYSDITDIVGIRVITYLLKDVEKISELIESEFHVDYDNSKNKADDLGHNEFGYRAKHYVLRLNENRAVLSEYSSYKNIWFELQIKTLPQHAWAEISHDKDYKFKGVLPDQIRRRFYIAASQIEAIDNEFQRISDDLDKHINEVALKINSGDLNIEIDTSALTEYLSFKFNTPKIHRSFDGKDADIVAELEKFGIVSLQDLDNIIPKDMLEKINNITNYSTNFTMLLRQVMIICDSTKFFEKCWGGIWPGTSGFKGSLYKAYDIDVELLKQKFLFANNTPQFVRKEDL